MTRSKQVPRPDNYRHFAWAALFLIVPVWYYLLQGFAETFQPIHIALDDHIPFVSAFVLPYALWYPLIVFTNILLIMRNRRDFLKGLALQISGFVCGLFTQTVYASCVDFRPADTGGGIFGYFVDLLYEIDRPINVMPSMHVYIALACALALSLARGSRISPALKVIIWIIAVFICLSTVFIKQHSALDGFVSIGLIAVLTPIIYLPKARKKTS